jgi:hypothetical protein
MSFLPQYDSNISVFSFKNATPCLGNFEFFFKQISCNHEAVLQALIFYLDFPDLLSLRQTCKTLKISINRKLMKQYIRKGCLSHKFRKNFWLSNINLDKLKSLIGRELNSYSDKIYETIHTYSNIDRNTENHKFKKVVDEINKDINRTFHFGRFKTEVGQQELKRVLQAIAYVRPEIGYCQGMNFVAAALLFFLSDEEMVFWTFLSFLDDRELNSLYFKVRFFINKF